MKLITSLFLLFAFYCVIPKTAIAYTDSLRVLPINPTKNDTIRVAVYGATPNPAKRVSIAHTVSGGDVYITACYAKKNNGAAINFFADTLVVGKMTEGLHHVYLTAYYSSGPDTNICSNIIDSLKTADSFTVVPPASVFTHSIEKLSIYPNPTSDHVTISLPAGSKLEQIVLQDFNGRELKRTTSNNLVIAELPSGIYILQVQTNYGRFAQRLRRE